MGYVAIHLYREFWAMSKKSLILQAQTMDKENGDDDTFVIDETILSEFDTIQLFSYALALFIGGVVGDIFDLRKLVSAAFMALSISYLLLGLGG